MTREEQDKQQADRYRRFAKEVTPTLTEFVNWLRENDYCIAENRTYKEQSAFVHGTYEITELAPIRISYEQLFARYLEIDLDAVERHRRRILDELAGVR